MSEQPTITQNDQPIDSSLGIAAPEADTPFSGRPLMVGQQQFLTDLPDGVEPFTADTTDATKHPLNPRNLDKLQPGEYTIYFAGDDQVEPYVPARSIVMRHGPKGLVVDSESFTPTFDGDSAGWTLLAGNESKGLLQSLGYEFASDESGLYISGVPTPETFRTAAAEHGIEVVFFEEKDIRSPEYLATIAGGKYPVSYDYFDHDIGDDHITAFLLGGTPLKESLQRVAKGALQLNRAEQDRVTAEIDNFTALYRGAINLAVDNDITGSKKYHEWVHQSGTRLGLTEAEIEEMLRVGAINAKQFEPKV